MIDETAETTEEAAPGEIPDAASPLQQKRIRNRHRREAVEAARFWQAVLADEVGRREVWGLLTAAHTFEERFACGPNGFPQTEATWFHAGEQAFGLRLFQTLLVKARAGTLTMLDEHDARFAAPKR